MAYAAPERNNLISWLLDCTKGQGTGDEDPPNAIRIKTLFAHQ
jgi:hypothetical protein